jgi:hypothetical protein
VRVPNSVYEARPWVIGKIAPDFKLLDAWALPVEGGRDEVEAFLERLASFDPADAGSVASRALFRIRLRLGAWFGWDDPTKKRPIPGCSETTLSARLSDGLRGSAQSPAITGAMARIAGGFVPLYRTDDEWAAEISNDTVHGVLHLGVVEQGEGRYRVQLGVYVKARGWRGEVYLKLIEPFRHLIVYPALMRQIGRRWNARDGAKR